MVTYGGLDVHKNVVEACVLDAAGSVQCRMRFALTPASLVQFCKDQLTRESQVVLEATTNAWAVVKLLRPLVGEALIVVFFALAAEFLKMIEEKPGKQADADAEFQDANRR